MTSDANEIRALMREAVLPLAHAVYALRMAVYELRPVQPLGADVGKHLAACSKALEPLFDRNRQLVLPAVGDPPAAEAVRQDVDAGDRPRPEANIRDEIARLDCQAEEYTRAIEKIAARKAELVAELPG